VEGLREPQGPGVRLDSGIYNGWTVPLEYDPLLAKLAVWASTREAAASRMVRALREYHVGGCRTNIALFRDVIQAPGFRSGELHTGFLEELPAPSSTGEPPSPGIRTAAALAAALHSAAPSVEPANGAVRGWVQSGRNDLLR
jgi:acetyl-CoA carboxylase, biotin carboxylase subunit